MRSIPVDLSRITFIGTGKTIAKAEYVELSDGSRQASGNQDVDDRGYKLWTVDVVIDDDDARRAEAIGVTVACMDEPVTAKWVPVKFRGMTATIYTDRASGQAKVSLRAEGVESHASVNGKPTPVAAAGS